MRVLVIGGPGTGKTTAYPDAVHTDDLIELGWSGASEYIADHLMAKPGPWTIEGVTAVRALRKALDRNADKRVCDRVVVMTQAKEPLTPGQLTMSKGVATVWREIRAEVLRRGIEVVES